MCCTCSWLQAIGAVSMNALLSHSSVSQSKYMRKGITQKSKILGSVYREGTREQKALPTYLKILSDTRMSPKTLKWAF